MAHAILLGLVGGLCFVAGHWLGFHRGLAVGWTNGWAAGWAAVAELVRQGEQAPAEAPAAPPPAQGLRLIRGGKANGP